MKTQPKGHFSHSLNQLLKRYTLSEQDLKTLNAMDENKIVSLAYTDYGGFDEKTGNYYAEERDINYKLKVDYLKDEAGGVETLIMLPVTIS